MLPVIEISIALAIQHADDTIILQFFFADSMLIKLVVLQTFM
jgi:hypothetical protein